MQRKLDSNLSKTSGKLKQKKKKFKTLMKECEFLGERETGKGTPHAKKTPFRIIIDNLFSIERQI